MKLCCILKYKMKTDVKSLHVWIKICTIAKWIKTQNDYHRFTFYLTGFTSIDLLTEILRTTNKVYFWNLEICIAALIHIVYSLFAYFKCVCSCIISNNNKNNIFFFCHRSYPCMLTENNMSILMLLWEVNIINIFIYFVRCVWPQLLLF